MTAQTTEVTPEMAAVLALAADYKEQRDRARDAAVALEQEIAEVRRLWCHYHRGSDSDRARFLQWARGGEL